MKFTKTTLPIVFVTILVFASTASTQVNYDYNGDCDESCISDLAKVVRAHRLDSEITLDGVLDEPVWQNPTAAPLIQNNPSNGCLPVHSTNWWVAYDAEALYVGARLFDSAPDSIEARLGRRDTWPQSDWVYINLDTFNDDRNAYSFSLNPAGVVGDAVLYNDGWDDSSWDGVWEVATLIDGQGWTAEVRIPFSQLNFPEADQQIWGINFSRRISRSRERDEIFYNPRGGSGYGCRFPDLVGIQGIKPKRSLEIKPYTSVKGEFLEVAQENPFRDGRDFGGNVGLDVKYGLSSNLNLVASINPDFGQVEVDPAVINLSDSESYFSERRPFFVEDANIFRFGREGTNNNWGFNWGDPTLLYSRRIGRAPQLLGSHDYTDCPINTTILGAGKLSGKIGGISIGALTAVTAREKANLVLDGNRSSQVVEPLTNYSVVRAKSVSDDGRQGLGGMITSTIRDLDDPVSQVSLDRRAYTGGLDGWLTLDDDGVWALKGYLSGSYITGSKESIDGLQRSSRRYYQRPQADHLDYDPDATTLQGLAGRAMLNKQSGNVRLNTAVGTITPGYEINDIGFMYGADKINWHCALGYRWLEPNKVFRDRALDVATYKSWDFGGTPDSYGAGAFWFLVFKNYWAMGGSTFLNPARNSIRATRGGPIMRQPSFAEGSLWLDTDSRKPLYLMLEGSGWNQDETSGARGGVRVVVKPRNNLEFSFGPEYSWRQDLQYVTSIEDASMEATYGGRYLFSDLEYRQFSLGTRINWTASPKFTIQAYIQPLFATGKYRNMKEFARPNSYEFNDYGLDNGSTITLNEDNEYVVDPDGAGPAESFSVGNPDFNVKSFKANVVMRWEYRPGSTFYLVWTQDRVNFEDPGDFSLGRDSKALFSAPGEDILMAKFTYWFDL